MSEKIDNVTLAEIVAVMVHDLNNPIAALGTNLRFLENLMGASASAEVAETLSDMRMLCELMSRHVRNLGMLGQGNPPPARPATMDVVALALGAVERMKKHAQASDMKLTFETAWRAGDVFVERDPDLCERSLDSLLAFAIERAASRATLVVSVVNADSIGVAIQFKARPESVEPSSHPSRSRTLQSSWGRGLSLHCARFAGEATGASVGVRRSEADQMTLDLVLRPAAKQIA